jgi:cytochrome c-type biogenesis protein CcmH/NrfG
MKRNGTVNVSFALADSDDDPVSIRFFEEGTQAPKDPLIEPTPRARPVANKARRAEMQRYVKATMVVCLGICALAIVGRLCWAAPPEAAVATASRTSGAVMMRDADVEAFHERVLLGVSAPTAAATATAITTATVPHQPPTLEERQKDAARHALELRDLDRAVEASRAAVDLDEEDADAWLLLGAAHLERKELDEARRAFQACTDRATHGDKRDCRALRF